MELLRSAVDPWGRDVWIGVSWGLIWVAVAVGALFVVGHALFVPKKTSSAEVDPGEAHAPDALIRHSSGSRAFHWLMAVAMFVLLITAFFPLVGIRFPWVTIHWIAGLGLTLTIVYHVIHVLTMQDMRTMWIGRRDVIEGGAALRQALGGKDVERPRAAKYPVDQKLYHHAATVVALGAIVTGVLMMFRVETPFWTRNPYILGDGTWGLVYVLHGLCGIALIFLVISHVYFALRPEKRWMTWSMIHGRISRTRYLEHHDPALWDPTRGRSGRGAEGGGGSGLDRAIAQGRVE